MMANGELTKFMMTILMGRVDFAADRLSPSSARVAAWDGTRALRGQLLGRYTWCG